MQQAIEAAINEATAEDFGKLIGSVIRERNAGIIDDEANIQQYRAIAGGFLVACQTGTVNSNIFCTIEHLAADAVDRERVGQIIQVRSVLLSAVEALEANGWAGDFWGPGKPADHETVPGIAAEIAGALYQVCATVELTDLAHELTKLAYWN